jgi:hypothetical protein
VRERRPSSQTTVTGWGVVHSWLASGPDRSIEVGLFGTHLAVYVRDRGARELEVVRADEDPSRAVLRATARLTLDEPTPV